MTKVCIFSTCHAKGYESFGREYLKQALEYLPQSADIHFFAEDFEQDIEHERLFWYNIEDVQKWKDFKLKNLDHVGIVQKENGKSIYNYRLNAVGFSAKIFPLEVLVKKGYDWIISLDCDIKFKKHLPEEILLGHLPPGATAVYLGRKDYAHTETGFVAYNMNRNADRMIKRMISIYETGEVFKLEGWTDSYVFDHVRELFESVKTDYYRFYNISKEMDGLHVWPKTWLAEYMDHLKGPAAKEGVGLLNEFPNTLIGQAVHTVTQFKPRTIIDIGCADGARSVALAKASLWAQKKKPVKDHPPVVHLWALDPFNTKQEEILQRLHGLAEEDDRFTFTYISKTLHPDKWQPELQVEHEKLGCLELGKADFAYVDGEHTVEELQRNLTHMVPYVKMVMSPTYFLPDAQGNGPDTNILGCNNVVQGMPYKLLPAQDEIEGGGVAKAVVFGPAITPGSGKVQTRNAVPDEVIQKNIEYSTKFDPNYMEVELEKTENKIKELRAYKKEIKNRREVQFINQCVVHDLTGLIIAGGPSVVDPKHPDHDSNWDKIKKYMARDDVRTFTVKTTHDHMIYDLGIIPYGTVLLDPRGHVVDFIEDPHEDVTYFVSSMCDSSTWDRLIEKAPKLFGYNAAVKAGEISFVHKTLEHRKAVFFGGGSSSATRAIGILHGLGFRKFLFAGFDQCWYPEVHPVDMDERDPQGRPKFIEVDMFGRKFVTQPILLAALQDVETSMKEHPDLEVSAITDGMCKVVVDKIKRDKHNFFDVYDK